MPDYVEQAAVNEPANTQGGVLARGIGSADDLPWPLVRSSVIFDLQYGKALVEATRRVGAVPVYGSNGVTGWHDTPLFSGPGIVLGRKGMGNLGVEWVDRDFWVIDTAYSLNVAENVDLKFAYYLVGYVGLNHLKHGSSNPSLTREAFGSQLFPLPLKDEQRRIAAVLSAFDELIEANRRQIASMASLAQLLAATASSSVSLSELANQLVLKQIRPEGMVEQYSLPAYDDEMTPEVIHGAEIKSSKFPIEQPTVLVSRLNPKWERCWMAYPEKRAVASTEFVQVVGSGGVATEEVWAVTSTSSFWDQMRERVTGTTGSHQRVGKESVMMLEVPDVRTLSKATREQVIVLVRMVQACRGEIADLTRTRDELLPLLMSGKVRTSESLEVV